jgi:hypothetical protein
MRNQTAAATAPPKRSLWSWLCDKLYGQQQKQHQYSSSINKTMKHLTKLGRQIEIWHGMHIGNTPHKKLRTLLIVGLGLWNVLASLAATASTVRVQQQQQQQNQFPGMIKSGISPDSNTMADADLRLDKSSLLSDTSPLPVPVPVIFDVISIGSLTRPEQHETQHSGLKDQIRNYYPITELNDTDSYCYTDLTMEQMDSTIDYCQTPKGEKKESFIAATVRRHLYRPQRTVDWMCGQKRAIDGLYRVLAGHSTNNEKVKKDVATVQAWSSLPDYLILVQDDTFVNVGTLADDLLGQFPANETHVVAGCARDIPDHSSAFIYPDMLGTIFTRIALERLLKPIHCHDSTSKGTTSSSSSSSKNKNTNARSSHSMLACFRLKFNALGEAAYFHEGMSVLDLMHAYISNRQTVGDYCLHSEHALAFFVNFYHIPVPELDTSDENFKLKDKIRRQYSIESMLRVDDVENDTCEQTHLYGNCDPTSSLFCHQIRPEQMTRLYKQAQGFSYDPNWSN